MRLLRGACGPGSPEPGASPGGRVLLVGEAEGLLASRLAREWGCGVTWLEPAEGPGTALRAADGRIERLVASPLDMPFEDGTFDATGSQFTLELLADPGLVLAECRRVLRPDGCIAVVVRNALFTGRDPLPRPRPASTFTPEKLKTLLAGSGFEVGKVCTLIPDLKVPRLYRGTMSFSKGFERLPWFRDRGMLLFASAVRRPGG